LLWSRGQGGRRTLLLGRIRRGVQKTRYRKIQFEERREGRGVSGKKAAGDPLSEQVRSYGEREPGRVSLASSTERERSASGVVSWLGRRLYKRFYLQPGKSSGEEGNGQNQMGIIRSGGITQCKPAQENTKRIFITGRLSFPLPKNRRLGHHGSLLREKRAKRILFISWICAGRGPPPRAKRGRKKKGRRSARKPQDGLGG